ncbi:hypothetical protein G7046_g4099 [Stylonectria norvegica]|nr:hypothetical protein G7046_g4099 [Stylonectria norvegica]
MRLCSATEPRPAALMMVSAVMVDNSPVLASCTSTSHPELPGLTPRGRTSTTGEFSATIPPASSKSPFRHIISPCESTMPVVGLSSAHTALTPSPSLTTSAPLTQRVLAADAQLGLEAAGRVVDARVDDLAVARAGLGADGAVPLDEDGGCVVAEGELAGYGEADDAAADDLKDDQTMVLS